MIADDRTTADAAYGLACQGTGLLWRGDFQNARQIADRAGEPRGPSAAQAEAAGGTGGAAIARRSLQSASPGPVAARAHAGHAADPTRRRLRHRAATRARRPAGLRWRPTARPTDPRSSRCASCWVSSARTSGAARASRSRRSAAASIRTTACSRRFAASTSTWSPRHRCRPRCRRRHGVRHRHRDRCARGRARAARHRARGRDRPGSRVRWPARARTSGGSGWRGKWRSCRPISFPKDGPRSWCAIRPGCRRGRARPSSAASTIPRAACCVAFLARAGRAPRTRRRGLADPLGPRRASRPALANGAARSDRRGGSEGRRATRRAARRIRVRPMPPTRCTRRARPR